MPIKGLIWWWRGWFALLQKVAWRFSTQTEGFENLLEGRTICSETLWFHTTIWSDLLSLTHTLQSIGSTALKGAVLLGAPQLAIAYRALLYQGLAYSTQGHPVQNKAQNNNSIALFRCNGLAGREETVMLWKEAIRLPVLPPPSQTSGSSQRCIFKCRAWSGPAIEPSAPFCALLRQYPLTVLPSIHRSEKVCLVLTYKWIQ